MDLQDRNDLRELKKRLRKETLANRKALAEETPLLFEEFSSNIIETLKRTDEYKKARTIMVFVSFEDEVMTHQFIKDALADGKNIYVPHILKQEKLMVPAQIFDFDKDLEPGYFGILSPIEDEVLIKDPSEIDLVVTPGVLFDERGYRIGYGAGFYDRFFSKLNAAVPRIGLGFSLQQTEEVPVDEFDIPIHALITENGITVFNQPKQPN